MSTYCHRIVEFYDKNNQWVRCGEFVDNFHGFDQWKNEDYYDRGFPENTTVKQEEITDSEDGREYVWGKSYVTMTELNAWIDKEKEESMSYLFNTIKDGMFYRMINKINDIHTVVVDHAEPSKQDNSESDDDIRYDPLSNYDYFKDNVNVIFEQYESLCGESIAAWSVVETMKVEDEYWIDPERVRIVFYFD